MPHIFTPTVLAALYLAYVAFAAALPLEAHAYQRKHGKRYPWAESGISVVLGFAHGIAGIIAKALVIGVVGSLVWSWRIYTMPLDKWWAWVLLFLAEEFAYYWYHRSSHRVRFLWAGHRVHHSTNELTFATGYRLYTTPLLHPEWVFFMPIVWIGFPLISVFGLVTVSLLYQFWVHTTLVPPLGPIEGILNTPSAHRVHHATNAKYLDMNYGGILMIFDRLFGTYQPEDPAIEIRYGLVYPERTLNPLWVAYGGYVLLLRKLRQAHSWRERWNLLFTPLRGGPHGQNI
jgi:sterol desaturase/sphingolipid hydroxylase (fatty acid hydroxylase superfamily)